MFNLTQLAIGSSVTQYGNTGGDLTGSVTSILSVVIGVLGLVAVGVMIVGGVNYMTSVGEAAKVEKAKKTILYGLIGLVICALAFVIVNFVIGTILGQSGGSNASSYTNQADCERAGFRWNASASKCE